MDELFEFVQTAREFDTGGGTKRASRSSARMHCAHYHGERNHQGIANGLIEPSIDNSTMTGRVVRRKRNGGMLNFYHRAASKGRLYVRTARRPVPSREPTRPPTTRCA